MHRKHFWDHEAPVAPSDRAKVQPPRARRYIIAIAILHNIALHWNDVEPVGGIRRNVRAMRVPPELQFEIIADDAEPAIVHARGQELRDQLCANMPP